MPISSHSQEETPELFSVVPGGSSGDIEAMRSAEYREGPASNYGLEPFYNYLKANPLLIPILLYGVVSALSNAMNGFLYISGASPETLLEDDFWNNQSKGDLALAGASAASSEATNAVLNVFFLLSIATSFYATKNFLQKKPGYLALAVPLEVCAISAAAAQSMISYDNFDFLSDVDEKLLAVNLTLTTLTFISTALSRTFGAVRSLRIFASLFDEDAKLQRDIYEQLHHIVGKDDATLEKAFQKAVLHVVNLNHAVEIANHRDNKPKYLHLSSAKDAHLRTEILIEFIRILSKPKNGIHSERSALSVVLGHLGTAFDHSFGLVVGAAPTFITYSQKTFGAIRKVAKLDSNEAAFIDLNSHVKRAISAPGGMGSALLYYVSGKDLRLNLLNLLDHVREHKREPAEYIKAFTCFVLAATSGLSMADVAHKIEADYQNDIFQLSPDTDFSKAYEYLQMCGAIIVNFNALVNQLILKNPELIIAIENGEAHIANRHYTHKAFLRTLQNPVANPFPMNEGDKAALKAHNFFSATNRETRPNAQAGAGDSLLLDSVKKTHSARK